MGKKKKDRWTLLAEAAVELNKTLGLEPPIETTDVSEEDLEEKIQEASLLVQDEDEFTEQTEKILDEFLEAEEEEFEEEAEEEEETEAEENEEAEAEDEEADIDLEDIRVLVEDTKKRKDLRIFAQDNEDIFGPVVEKLPELKSAKALKGAMLKHLDELIEDDEEEEQKEEKKAPKKKKSSKSKSAPGSKSNKAIAYLAWKEDGVDDAKELHKIVEERVKLTTVQSWLSAWGKGKNLPAIAKEE